MPLAGEATPACQPVLALKAGEAPIARLWTAMPTQTGEKNAVHEKPWIGIGIGCRAQRRGSRRVKAKRRKGEKLQCRKRHDSFLMLVG